MMALGGAIGVGLVIGTGTALRQGRRRISARLNVSQPPSGGPLGILLGYSFLGAFPSLCISRPLADGKYPTGMIWYASLHPPPTPLIAVPQLLSYAKYRRGTFHFPAPAFSP